MPHARTLEAIRELVRASFVELGAGRGLPLSEHILIRGDLYCGRRFRCNDLHAVWFIEEEQIKVYGPEGSVVRVLQPPQLRPQALHTTATRRAA